MYPATSMQTMSTRPLACKPVRGSPCHVESLFPATSWVAHRNNAINRTRHGSATQSTAVSGQRQPSSTETPSTANSAAATDNANSQQEEWIEIGVIGPPHGVRGEMKVQPFTDFPEDRLGTPGTRWLQPPAPKLGNRPPPPATEVKLVWGRSHISKGHDMWLVKLEDVNSPEEVQLLRGHTLLIPASMRDPLEDEDEFYIQDLVGLNVFLKETGEQVGVVIDVFDGTGAHDVLRIGLSNSEEEKQVLIPFVREIVPIVDVNANRMEIEPPAGLLDLAMPVQQLKQTKESRGKRIKEPVKQKKKSE